MGTISQQFGHDWVLMLFMNKVLKPMKKFEFFIVSRAEGPRIDIHFWNPSKDEFTSAFNFSGEEGYIPEFLARVKYSPKLFEMRETELNYKYQSEIWYKKVMQVVGTETKTFIKELCEAIEKETGDLPDLIGFDKNGQEVIHVELKFEGYGKDSHAAVLKQAECAKKRSVPFWLILPTKPSGSRGRTNSWIKRNIPAEVTVYKFNVPLKAVIPKEEHLELIKVQEGSHELHNN